MATRATHSSDCLCYLRIGLRVEKMVRAVCGEVIQPSGSRLSFPQYFFTGGDWQLCHWQPSDILPVQLLLSGVLRPLETKDHRSVRKRSADKMYQIIKRDPIYVPWIKGKLVGQKLPLKLQDIWAIQNRLR